MYAWISTREDAVRVGRGCPIILKLEEWEKLSPKSFSEVGYCNGD